MGVNYCKAEEPELDEFEEDRSEKKEVHVEVKQIPSPKPQPLDILRFDLNNKIKDNPPWNSKLWEFVRIVETPGKEFKEFATSRVDFKGKQKVVLGSMGTLLENNEVGEFSIGEKDKFLSERLKLEGIQDNVYCVNGIDNVRLDGDLTVLCNVDFEDLFPEDLIKEIEGLNYSKDVYQKIQQKLFDKNFLFR